MRRRMLIALLLIVGLTAATTAVSAAEYQAGFAKVSIMPDEPTWLSGYASRTKPAEGKVHDLYAKAAAFEDAEGTRLVLVTLDLGSVNPEMTKHVAREVDRRFKLPPSNLVLNCSHTHCAPEVSLERRIILNMPEEEHEKLDRYIEKLNPKLVELVGQALADLKPAKLSVGNSRAEFAVNRRGPKGIDKDGVTDHEVPVMQVTDLDGKLRGVLFGYACHNTTLNFQLYCGDYAGFAQYDIEQAHPEAVAMFVMGCGGDQNPHPRRGRMGLEHAKRHGSELAQAVEKVLAGETKPLAGPLRVAYGVAQLELEPLPSIDRLRAEAKLPKSQTESRKANYLLGLIDSGAEVPLMQSCPLHVARFGEELLMIFISGETVVDYSLRCKRDFAGPMVWVAGYSDDVFAYLPSKRVLLEGGYEGRTSVVHQLMATPFLPNVEELVMQGVARLVGQTQTPATANKPNVRIKRELYRKQEHPEYPIWVKMYSTGPDGQRMEVVADESSGSDVWQNIRRRVSSDNGRTWSEFEKLPDSHVRYKGVSVFEGDDLSIPLYDPQSGVLVQSWLRQIQPNGLKGPHKNFTYYRLSRDHGRTWSEPKQLKYEPGPDFDPADPLNPEFLSKNNAYLPPNSVRCSDGTLVVCPGNVPNKQSSAKGVKGEEMGAVCFMGRWNAEENDYDWIAGEPVFVTPKQSSRGLLETNVAQLNDGRLLVVWRGSNAGLKNPAEADAAGRKLFSISNDGGQTLSPVKEWKYADGSRFYSPSSLHRLFRHEGSGKLYWIGNICPQRPNGNHPRFPLVIAEIDEDKAAIKKETVTVIADRPEGASDKFQLSNFSILENPEDHSVELLVTHYDGGHGGAPRSGDCYKYTLTFH